MRQRTLILASTSLHLRQRGRDTIHCALAALALDWPTRVLLLDDAGEWLHALDEADAGLDRFARALPSLESFGLEHLGVCSRLSPPATRLTTGWLQALDSAGVRAWLRWADQVLHP